MKKYKGIIFDSAGLGEASKYSKTTYKLNNWLISSPKLPEITNTGTLYFLHFLAIP